MSNTPAKEPAPDKSQKALSDFKGETIKIIADHREVPSGVVRELKRMGLAAGLRHVESGPLVRSSYHAANQIPT